MVDARRSGRVGDVDLPGRDEYPGTVPVESFGACGRVGSMPVDADTIRRLAFIRYLHTLGTEQARLPEPLSGASLLMLHDAVESFLVLATDHFGAKATREFEKYWETLSPYLPDGVDLAVQQGMKRLNKARVSLKHYDAPPGRDTINMAVADTATFMATNTVLVFGLDYETVSMAYVIPQEPVRELVRKAETASGSGDQAAAMISLVEALEELFEPHSARAASRGGTASPFRFGPTLSIGRKMRDYDIEALLRRPPGERRPVSADPHTLASQIASVTEIVEKLQPAVRVTAIGLDFAAYQRFLSLTPAYVDYFDGRREYRAPRGYTPTQEDFNFCLQFVVSAALRLAEVEAHLTRPSWMPERQPGSEPWETICAVRRLDRT